MLYRKALPLIAGRFVIDDEINDQFLAVSHSAITFRQCSSHSGTRRQLFEAPTTPA